MGKWSKYTNKLMDWAANNPNEFAKTINDASENGIIKATGNFFKRKAYRKIFGVAKNAMKVVAKTVFKWLFTTPPGWLTLIITGVVIGVIGVNMKDNNDSNESKVLTTNSSQTSDQNVTAKKYAAIQTGCPTGVLSTSTASGSVELTTSKSDFTLEEVSKFATSSIKSTWKVSEDKAASYFLTRNSAVATKYGLTTDNINNVTDVVKSVGVSPVFFYLYAVNEGGGEGGFINHYQAKDMTGDAVQDAKMDAEYIKQYANSVGGTPSLTSDMPQNTPTEPAQKLLDQMKQGTVGRIYIQATAAVTGEIADLSGLHGEWTGLFGKPLSQTMSSIIALGGDVNAGDEISTVNLSKTNSSNCNPGNHQTQNLKSGGMSLEEARQWMLDNYVAADLTAQDVLPALPGLYSPKTNCVAFTWYFIKNFTDLKVGSGDGKDCADTLASANNLKTSHTPSVYSVFSVGSYGAKSLWSWVGNAGHTGVVLGIDTEKNVAIIGEAMYELPYTTVDTVNSGINVIEIPLDKMTEEEGWTFTDVTDHMKDLQK